jgi:hypothetical protein
LKWCGKFELLKLQENEKTIDNGGEGTNRWTKKELEKIKIRSSPKNSQHNTRTLTL